MRTRWERLGALAVAMTLLAGGAMGLDVGRAAAAPLATVTAPGAGIDAPALYRLQQPSTNAQGTDGGEAEGAAEDEGAGENATGGDEATDGVDCAQEGAHEGENEGC